MKILLIGNGSFSKLHGGGEVYVRNLTFGLMTRNQAVIYLSMVFDNTQAVCQVRLNNDAVEEWQLRIPKQWLKATVDFESNIVKILSETIEDINPDVIHAHGWKHHVCLSAKLSNIPCVITAHHGGVVCPAGALLKADDTICRVAVNHTDCLKCCVKPIFGGSVWYELLKYIPLFSRLNIGNIINQLPVMYFLTPLGLVTLAIYEKIRSISDMGQYASKIIAPSPAIQDALIRNGIARDKISFVPHAIPAKTRLPLSNKLGSRPLRFIFIGRISYVKGLHILMQACTQLEPSTYELHVVGSPGSKQENRYFDRLQKKYSLENITWHGYKSSDQITQILGSCDVMIHPAICLEVFGLVIAESLSVGRPVIATKCGGPEIQIQDGINGFLISPNDPNALVLAMKRLIDEPVLVQSMSRNIQGVGGMSEHVLEIEKIYHFSIKHHEKKL